MAGPRQLVDPPAFTPLPYGLLEVVSTPAAADGHWQNGVTWQARCVPDGAFDPATGTWYDDCVSVTGIAVTGTGEGTPSPADAKVETVELVIHGATPFTVVAEFDCAPVGMPDAQAAARDALAQAEPWQVERAFWTGSVNGVASVAMPHLAADAVAVDAQGYTLQTAATQVTDGATPYDVAHGLGLLEAALANCHDGVGVIHIPRIALPTFDAAGLLRQNGTRLKTLAGNDVALGAGYPGTGPDGSARPAGQSWIYATGPVFDYRGSVFITQPADALDRAENTVKMIAERTHVLGFDCCHLATLITLGTPT